MKNCILIILFLFTTCIYAQVGIETTNPTATLDINGDLRIRSTTLTTNLTAAKDSIIVVDNVGNSKRVSSKTVVNSYLKTVIKGQFSSGALVNLNLLSNRVKIPFDLIQFDANSEFNTTTNTFTAKQDGIYAIKIQIKSNSTVGVSTNFGVAITKNGTIINRNSFANISVLSTNVTPPVRQVESLIELTTGDTVIFEIVSDLASVSILGTSEDCFFTIQQIR
ncbi:hypothetical protein GOQ30_00205 [Flavobacterium sp. TP390]|uniref:C1q domain-containing protein n=1 Tax=Flavobacterium profundi TaxID=1774945 RepID=A0A6I4II94_9FLAO|nr:hypothetical protein [Flavobacterium profundi]MVO07579.1 hypothetical protein [Flavobacterium profundi]